MPETLYLIDGHAQIFRAYFAIRGGMNSPVTGEPTHATFGFTGMLLKLFEQFHPHYVCVAIDMPGKTFRDEMFEAYKATREAMPEDLRVQILRILAVTEAFGVPVLGIEGFEADDVIATVTQRMLDNPAWRDIRICIVSRDKDLQQLLGDRVTMFDIHTEETLDVQRLQEEKGISPDQVVDLLALTGDTSDNVPGVEGIGPKTATQLIQEFGSIDGIYANLDKLKGKRKENLEKARETLPLSRRLVTLDRRIEMDFDLDKARVGAIDGRTLRSLFQELGFTRHRESLDKLVGAPRTGKEGTPSLFDALEPPSPPPAVPSGMASAADCDYRAVVTRAELDELAATIMQQPLLSIDTETDSINPMQAQLCGLSFAWEEGHGVYVPVRSPAPEQHLDAGTVLAALRPVLENPDVPKCGHNLKYDCLVLRQAGVRLRGIVHDSFIASHLLGNQAHGLDHLAVTLLQHAMIPITSLIGTTKPQRTMDEVPWQDIVPYAAEDADIALRLGRRFAAELETVGMTDLAARVEMPLVAVLAEMQCNGITLDPSELTRQGEAWDVRIAELRQMIHDVSGYDFNLDSPKQLAEILFEKLGLPVIKRTKTGPSTDIEVLQKLADREDRADPRTAVPRLIVEYRQFTKLRSTYLENLKQSMDPQTGRIHATFNQTGAATGRLSSHSPNLQNIPIRTDVGRQIRKAFIAAPGHALVCADYSQIELRLLAHLSNDPNLIEAFHNDLDIHTAVAAQVFRVAPDQVSREQRDHAKTINFGIIYGVTPYGLARRIEGMTVEAAGELITGYKQRFPGIQTFLQECIHAAESDGYVTTIMGRRRPVPEIASPNGRTRSLGERLAINSVVQGSAADLIKLAMVNVQRRIDSESLPLRMLLQIHDELVFETPAVEAEAGAAVVRHEMEHAMDLQVPLRTEVGVGPDWYTTK